MARKRRSEAYVRFFRHELECPAFRSLSPDARALLVEFRALFDGRRNRIYMSVRQTMQRIGVGQRRAQRALSDLVEKGWIRLIEPGGFSRKVRHATVFALTNEPLEDRDGATAPKDYMRWRSATGENTVANSATVGSQSSYREISESATPACHGSQFSYRKPETPRSHGSQSSYTDSLPGRGYVSGESSR